MGLDMKCDITGNEQRDETHDPEISPILANNDLARGGRYDQRQKAHIDDRSQQPADLAGKRNGDATRHPNRDKTPAKAYLGAATVQSSLGSR